MKEKEQKTKCLKEDKNAEIPIDWNDMVKAVAEFIKSDNAKKAVEQYFSNQTRKIENERISIESSKKYESKKYWQDIIMVGIILVSILAIVLINSFSTSSKEIINASTIGTLFGGIIGYALGRFKSASK